MSGNKKGTEGYSLPRAKRKRKGIELMLSDAARERLHLLAPEGRRSEFVEGLIMAAPLPGSKR